jgi:hypothetical protein
MGIGTAGGGGAYLGEGGATFTKNVRGCCSGRIHVLDLASWFTFLPSPNLSVQELGVPSDSRVQRALGRATGCSPSPQHESR